MKSYACFMRTCCACEMARSKERLAAAAALVRWVLIVTYNLMETAELSVEVCKHW